MGAETQAGGGGATPSQLEHLQESWGWFLALGIISIILGLVAIGAPFVTTLAIDLLIGWLLAIGGVVQGVHAFGAKRWSGFFAILLSAILQLVVGVLLLAFPRAGMLTLTLLLAAYLIVDGIFKIFLAFHVGVMGRSIIILLSGAVALLLGVLIWAEWPSSAAWIIGLFFGVYMIMAGISMIVLALAARGSKQTA